ncbi:MAG: acyl-phosphate glycerol 3-phosphate acyltransferase [Gammaproteobacteria bacterium SG8_15]|nr:MAG: acyl-phosphate glycerol 3-phosphate acyltransferase [Gammaproteobacteria bacterium SG8_15]
MFELDTTFFILVLIGYLMGSLSTAIIVCRLMGLPDPRTTGSQNPGATNVLRIGGKKAAAITLAGDAVKGLAPVLIGYAFQQTPANLGIIGFAAFLGHLYPVFFSFKGGKGVATAFGAIVGISWMVGLAVLATWLIMAKLFKISSLSALTAAVLTPLYFWLIEANIALLITSIVMSVMLIFRHRSNIRNLIKGTEDTIQ